MRTWYTVREHGDRWTVTFDDEVLPCDTRDDAAVMARELAKQRWTDFQTPTGVRIELTASGAAGELLYGS